MATAQLETRFEESWQSLAQADADSLLQLLHSLYLELDAAIAISPPAILFSQTVQRLVQQICQVERQERRQVLQEILQGLETRFSREYDQLGNALKFAFWYRILPLLPAAEPWEILPLSLRRVVSSFRQMDYNQQMHFLRLLLERIEAQPLAVAS